MHEPLITVVGNVGAPPRMRVLAGGAVVTDFRIASTPRKKDRVTDTWTDRETMWFGITCWRALAENVAASLQKGDRVVVTGKLGVHTWETEQGEKRSGLEIEAATVGFDLLRGKAVQERSVPITVTSDPGRPADEDEDGDGDGDGGYGRLDADEAPVREPVSAAA